MKGLLIGGVISAAVGLVLLVAGVILYVVDSGSDPQEQLLNDMFQQAINLQNMNPQDPDQVRRILEQQQRNMNRNPFMAGRDRTLPALLLVFGILGIVVGGGMLIGYGATKPAKRRRDDEDDDDDRDRRKRRRRRSYDDD